jgi:hypothetical protein
MRNVPRLAKIRVIKKIVVENILEITGLFAIDIVVGPSPLIWYLRYGYFPIALSELPIGLWGYPIDLWEYPIGLWENSPLGRPIDLRDISIGL